MADEAIHTVGIKHLQQSPPRTTPRTEIVLFLRRRLVLIRDDHVELPHAVLDGVDDGVVGNVIVVARDLTCDTVACFESVMARDEAIFLQSGTELAEVFLLHAEEVG